MIAEPFFERRRPGHEPKAEPVIDHCETAGSERETPPVDAGHMIAICGLREGQTGFGGELSAERIDLPATQRVDQVARNNDALSLAPSQIVPDKVIDPILQRLSHVRAK